MATMDWYRQRLADPELLRRAANVALCGRSLPAVPLGGRRVSGDLDAEFQTECGALAAADQLRGVPGFEGIRIVRRGERWFVEWGEALSIDGASSPAEVTRSHGLQYGYRPDAVEDCAERVAREE